MCNSHNAK